MRKNQHGFSEIIIIFIVVIIVAIFLITRIPTNYEECVKLPGSSATKMYPSTCTTFYGKSFAQENNLKESKTEIISQTNTMKTLSSIKLTNQNSPSIFVRNSIENLPKLDIPEGLEETQIGFPQKIGENYFVNFLKANINLPIYSKVSRSGILFANEGDASWKIFYELEELGNDSNNPYYLWNEGNDYYTIIIDTNGAGSGEGIGKLVRIDLTKSMWKIIDCFYYSQGSFIEYVNKKKTTESLSERIISYDEPSTDFVKFNGRYEYDQSLNKFTLNGNIEESCTNFDLII